MTEGTNIQNTEYLDGFQYTQEALDFFPHKEGYVKVVSAQGVGGSSSFNYVFSYTDHLGNIRLRYTKTETQGLAILEENHYYPFGLKHNGYNSDHKIFEFNDGTNTVVLTPVTPNRKETYKYKYNGKEFQDELGLNMYDYGWRNYMPDIGRWTQIDPLFNDLKFAHDINDVDPDDQEEVYMAIINDLEIGGGIYNTDNLNPYGYGYNNPVSFDDPDGRCPSCIWGAVIGAAVDYGLQVAVNYAEGKSGSDAWTDVSLTSIAVSAGAGALSGGISSLKQVKNASTIAKIGVGMATDTGVSVASQGIKNGKVTLKDTAIDVAAGRLATGVGNAVEKKVLNSSTGKKMAAAINAEKNIARGKSNTIPKNKADVKGAVKKLEAYAGKRSAVSATVSSGAASTAAAKLEEKKKKH
ncbi:MAG: hypothetical protein GW771_14040 [Flavobacteriia bacterium]|nr:hypothetical protein [Flavobacteriia bacterium]